MAELRNRPFYAGTISVIGPTTVYTVPAGHIAVLKSVVAHNLAATARWIYVYARGGRVQIKQLGAQFSASDTLEWRPWVVVPEGETIQLGLDAAGSVFCVLSGSIYYV